MKLKEVKDGDPPALLNIPYRMVFAVGTIDHVIIYSTQSIYPIAVVKNLHYDTINDLAWAQTNLLLVASSDGFCSFIKFTDEVIGERLPIESEIIPEFLHDHYQNLNNVNLHKIVEKVQTEDNTKFTKITFKSKKANFI